ncbi:MAG TPA: phage tail protein I [Azonexus sp.]|nr:phage tail protein I [Azonexus sp.]
MAEHIPNVLALDPRFGPLAKLAVDAHHADLSKLLIYLIDLVDEQAIPHLAEQFHVVGEEGWLLATTDQARRELIKRSIEVHRHKGTPWAIERLLESVGARAELREWWEMDPPGVPHTFEIDVYAGSLPVTGNSPLLGEVATKRMADLINSVKPVRSHYTLRVGASYIGSLAQGAALGHPVAVVTNKGNQPLETHLHGSQSWQSGAALSRPSAVATPTGYQRPDRALSASIPTRPAAVMSRPATIVSPLGGQQPDRMLAATIPTRPCAAMSRPAVFATAVFRNP